jgi:hypothetical protein
MGKEFQSKEKTENHEACKTRQIQPECNNLKKKKH